MRTTARTLRRFLVAVLLLCFIAVALWWGFWTLAAAEFRSSIDNWIDSGRAGGYVITFDDRQMFGFPHRVVLRFTNLTWKNTDGIAFHADNMDLSSLPWNKETFDARFRGHAQIAAPMESTPDAPPEGRALLLGGDEGRAHVVLDNLGYWKFTKISLGQARVGRSPDVLFAADHLEATAERPDKLPKDHNAPGLTLTGAAQNVVLPESMPEPFGRKMATLEMSLRVMGAVPDFRRKDSVTAWNNGSGVVEFDHLRMDWGVLRMTAKGTVGFDDDLQPEGAFASTIGNHSDVLKALMDQNFIAQRQAGMLNSALEVFAKPTSANADIEVPITIQLNGLFLGPVRVFVFPQIEWNKPSVLSAAPPAGDAEASVAIAPPPAAIAVQPKGPGAGSEASPSAP